jgi:hypothetical protein
MNFSRFDTVSLSQRSLFAECERRRNRLIQLLRWYDHQRTARSSELRRQSERVTKEARQQINSRSQVVMKERARLKHLLDDDRTPIHSTNNFNSLFHENNLIDVRKRRIYGCLLPQFKAPLTRSSDNWFQFKSKTTLSESNYKKRLDKQRWSIKKHIESPIEQRNRMNTIINKCLYEFEQCDGLGYDHFLQTSEPNRNAQILAQQIINEKHQNKIK